MTTTVRIATYSADPPACDAFHAYDPESFVLIPAFADCLVHVDIDGRIQPALSTSWKRVDPVTMDFELREGVRFHNGEPFDADSVVATLRAHVDPANPSFLGRGLLSPIKDCVKNGDRGVRVSLHFPDTMFLNRMALFSQIYPKSILAAQGPDGLRERPIGTGAYQLERWTHGEEIVLRRNPDHWAKVKSADEIVFPIVKQNQWVDLLAKGALDIALNIDPDEAFRARHVPGLTVRDRVGAMPQFFVLKNEGPLADKRVRQAMNYALHKPVLVRVASHGAAVAQVGVAGEGQLGFRPDSATYSYDVDRAQQLLEEAGHARGFKLTGLVSDQSAGLYSMVREFLARIGIELEAEIVPRAEWMMRGPVARMMGKPGFQGDFTLCAFDDPISHTMFQHFAQLSDKSPFSALRHDEYNRRFMEAVTTIDPGELERKIGDLEAFVGEEGLFLFTTREAVYTVCRSGYDIPLPATGHFDYASLWNIRTPAEPTARAPLPPTLPADPDQQRLLDATSFPGNLFLPGGKDELGSPAMAQLWRNIELHESRWRQTTEEMMRLIVDQALAQTYLENVARSTKQVGILLVTPDDRIVFANDGYAPVTGCSRGDAIGSVLWDDDGKPAWAQVKAAVDRNGVSSGVLNVGKGPGSTRRMFLTAAHAIGELGRRTGYTCTFADYSGEEDRQRRKAEAETAALVQKAIIPHLTQNDPDVAAHYSPASETGGDWFFVEQDDRHLTLIVGDVTGHGTAPALVTASVAGATSVLDLKNDSPQQVLTALNRVVTKSGFGQYRMTFLYMQVDKVTRRFKLSSAAHPLPMMFANGNLARLAVSPSQLLGEVADETNWPLTEGSLEPGTLVFLYTDGLLENTNASGVAYGAGRTMRYLKKAPHGEPCATILEGLVKDAEQFRGGRPPDDDLTVMLARVR